MQGCDRHLLRAYKRVIDDGFAVPFGEGRTLEEERSRAHGTQVTAETVAQVQDRGRGQSR
jgi:enoyl-CoA hydratase